MNTPILSLLRRWLTLLMVGLLALGPFLHIHVGVSHESGFHLDGMHAVHDTVPAGTSAMQASDDESPALGVAASLPHPEDEALGLLGMALLVTMLPLLPRRRLPLPCAQRNPAPTCSRYRAGLPPPCLAPPAA